MEPVLKHMRRFICRCFIHNEPQGQRAQAMQAERSTPALVVVMVARAVSGIRRSLVVSTDTVPQTASKKVDRPCIPTRRLFPSSSPALSGLRQRPPGPYQLQVCSRQLPTRFSAEPPIRATGVSSRAHLEPGTSSLGWTRTAHTKQCKNWRRSSQSQPYPSCGDCTQVQAIPY